jgi:hypothetical protein
MVQMSEKWCVRTPGDDLIPVWTREDGQQFASLINAICRSSGPSGPPPTADVVPWPYDDDEHERILAEGDPL